MAETETGRGFGPAIGTTTGTIVNSSNTRTILQIDVDAFEWQVVCKENPEYFAKPGIVVNPPSTIVAVSHEARGYGIERRVTRVKEARAKCPNLIVHYKTKEYGKPESTNLRRWSREIKNVILDQRNKKGMDMIVENASSDEFFLDVTQDIRKAMEWSKAPLLIVLLHILTWNWIWDTNLWIETKFRVSLRQVQVVVVGIIGFILVVGIGMLWAERGLWLVIFGFGFLWWLQRTNNGFSTFAAWLLDMIQNQYNETLRLLLGAALGAELVQAIQDKTGFTCSVGVSNNKLLAKLACSLNKPNGVTVLPSVQIPRIAKQIKVEKIPGLGGDTFGGVLRSDLRIETMYDLQQTKPASIGRLLGRVNCGMILNLAHGIDEKLVQERLASTTLSCSKSRVNIHNEESLLRWFGPDHLGGQLRERLEEERIHNRRRPDRVELLVDGKKIATVVYDGQEGGSGANRVLTPNQATLREKIHFPLIGCELKLFVPKFIPLVSPPIKSRLQVIWAWFCSLLDGNDSIRRSATGPDPLKVLLTYGLIVLAVVQIKGAKISEVNV